MITSDIKTMPKLGNRKFAYTKAGMKAYAKAKKAKAPSKKVAKKKTRKTNKRYA